MMYARLSSLFLALLCLLSLAACSGKTARVLIIVRESSDNMTMMIDNEVKPIQTTIKAAGFGVEIASETKALLGSGKSTLQPGLALSEVNLDNYVGIVVPCMAAGGTPKAMPSLAIAIIKSANARGLPIAAQQSGVELLAKAGVLVGKNYAIAEDSANLVPSGNYRGIGVVVDGKIVTSGTCPFLHAEMGLKDGTSEMMQNFIKLIR